MSLIDPGLAQAGWEILVEELGLEMATEFVILLERGKGDSVQEINDYWADATLAEIHEKVMAWKTTHHQATDYS